LAPASAVLTFPVVGSSEAELITRPESIVATGVLRLADRNINGT
jgi:hypothetical protein